MILNQMCPTETPRFEAVYYNPPQWIEEVRHSRRSVPKFRRGIRTVSHEEEKEGYSGMDLQKRKV